MVELTDDQRNALIRTLHTDIQAAMRMGFEGLALERIDLLSQFAPDEATQYAPTPPTAPPPAWLTKEYRVYVVHALENMVKLLHTQQDHSGRIQVYEQIIKLMEQPNG